MRKIRQTFWIILCLSNLAFGATATDLFLQGNESFRQKNYTKAYVEYWRASQNSLYSVEIQENLRLTKKILQEQTGTTQLDRSSTDLERLALWSSAPLQQWILYTVLFLVVFYLIISVKGVASFTLWALRPLSILCFLIIFIFTLLQVNAALAILHPQVICIKNTTLRTGPDSSYAEMSVIQEGWIVRVSSSLSSEWVQVRYNTSDVGWVPKSSLLLL